MDGPWQICKKTAQEYGRVAKETAKLMRWVDADVELAACGSSQRAMPSYGAWEYDVLDHCFEDVDYISLHAYFRNDSNNIGEFFTVIEDLTSFIREVSAIADAVAAKRRSPKRIMLSLDEWNVWYKAHTPSDLKKPGWPKAPHLIEEIYNFEDALVVGGALIAMMNNADRVKAACIAQLVNVIGPIMTETGGPAWRQTIFHPFALASRHAHGTVLKTKIETESYATATHKDVPYLLSTVLHDEESGAAAIFALNRSPDQSMKLAVELRGMGARRKISTALELHHDDLKAVNSRNEPGKVAPGLNKAVALNGETLTATLKPLSWNVIVTMPG
jgi:alpha-N-arabinofuranosidase